MSRSRSTETPPGNSQAWNGCRRVEPRGERANNRRLMKRTGDPSANTPHGHVRSSGLKSAGVSRTLDGGVHSTAYCGAAAPL